MGSAPGPFITDQTAAPDSVLSGDLMNGDFIRRGLHQLDSRQRNFRATPRFKGGGVTDSARVAVDLSAPFPSNAAV